MSTQRTASLVSAHLSLTQQNQSVNIDLTIVHSRSYGCGAFYFDLYYDSQTIKNTACFNIAYKRFRSRKFTLCLML